MQKRFDDRKIVLILFPGLTTLFGLMGIFLAYRLGLRPMLVDNLVFLSSCIAVGAVIGCFVSHELGKMKKELESSQRPAKDYSNK